MHLIIVALAALIAFGGSLGTKSTSAPTTSTAPIAASASLPSPTPAPMDIVGSGGPSGPLP